MAAATRTNLEDIGVKSANNQGTHSVGLHSFTAPKVVKFVETVWLAGAREGRHGARKMRVLWIGSVWLCSSGKLLYT